MFCLCAHLQTLLNSSADLKVWGFSPVLRRYIFFGVPRLLSKRESQFFRCFDLLGWMNSYPKSHFRLDLIGSFCSDDLTDLLSLEQLINMQRLCRVAAGLGHQAPTFRPRAISRKEPACRVRLDCCLRGRCFFCTSLQFESNSHISNWSSKWEAAWATCGLLVLPLVFFKCSYVLFKNCKLLSKEIAVTIYFFKYYFHVSIVLKPFVHRSLQKSENASWQNVRPSCSNCG